MKVYGIGRCKDQSGACRWSVNVTRRGKSYRKTFSDEAWGGSGKALAAAIAWRDRQLAKHRAFTRREYRQIRRSNNRSGTPGVYLVKQRRQPKGAWAARIMLPGGKEIITMFAVKRYGNRAAFQRAIKARAELLKLIEDQPFLYHAFAKKAAAKRRRRIAR